MVNHRKDTEIQKMKNKKRDESKLSKQEQKAIEEIIARRRPLLEAIGKL